MAMSANPSKKQNPANQIMAKQDAKQLLIYYTTPSNRLNDFWVIDRRRLIEACNHYRLEKPDWLGNKSEVTR